MKEIINRNIFVLLLIIVALAGLFLLLRQIKNAQEPLSALPNQIKKMANFIATSSVPAVEKKTEIKQPIKNDNSNEAPIDPTKISPLSGLSCVNYNRRPIAVIIANDVAARPLSGLSEADMVFEMQAVTGSITRLLAVFICNSPIVGSIRSARHDYIPLAMGVDAILAHWGGSHFALDKLNNHIMDNIDALKNPFGAFYRKSGIAAPHNGFSSIERLINGAKKMSYRLIDNFSGYPHLQIKSSEIKNQNYNSIKINYARPFNVEWQYNLGTNLYSRWRGDKKEIDKNNNRQVTAANVVLMGAKSRAIDGQYNDVDMEGEGALKVYENGEMINGIWKKDQSDQKSKLYFLDEGGNEIKFAPGAIWVEIVEPEWL